MKTLITLTLSTCMMLALTTSALAPPQPGQPPGEGDQPDGMALLEESHGLMKELAENDLPVGKVGAEVQNKEKKLIQNLDDLIQLVLDQNAEEVGGDDDKKKKSASCEKCGEKGQSKPGASKSGKSGKSGKPGGKPGGSEPAAMAGGVSSNPTTGNPFGKKVGELDKESEGRKADEWGLLPEAEFERVRMAKKTIVPKGYDELLERFRRAVIKEGAKLLPR